MTGGQGTHSGRPEADFLAAILAHIPDAALSHIEADGKIRRFSTSGKKKDDAGWYSATYAGPVLYGSFGDWRTGINEKWRSGNYQALPPEQKKAVNDTIRAAQKATDAGLKAGQAEAAKKARYLYGKFAAAKTSPLHPYLARKGVSPSEGIRQGEYKGIDTLYIPHYWGRDMVSFQAIGPDGQKRNLAGAGKGYFPIGKDKTGPICLAEGIATALSIHEATGWPCYAAFDADNLIKTAAFLKPLFPDREFLICADDDHESRANKGMLSAKKAAAKCGAYLARPRFLNAAGKTDFNDMHQEQGAEAVRQSLVAALENGRRQAEKPQSQKHGNGEYVVGGFGVHFIEEGGGKIWLSSPLRVLAYTRDRDADNWGRLLEWYDDDGNRHQWAMPQYLLKGNGEELRGALLSGGVSIGSGNKARGLLMTYLQAWQTDKRARCIDRLGWYGGAYVMPDETLGQKSEIIVYQNEAAVRDERGQSGTVAEWTKHVAKPAEGNSRLVFGICLAFAAPLLDIAGEESRGFHFLGGSSSGKTTALYLASSVYGKADRYTRSWRATANGLENIAAAHNDGFLVLDEFSQISAKEVVRGVIYHLMNGQGKARASRSGGAKPAQNWRMLLLSSGEEGLAAKAAREGEAVNVGEELRFVEIDADAGIGIFETAQNRTEAAALANTLKEAATRFYGAAGYEWLKHVVSSRDSLKAALTEKINNYVSILTKGDASGQATRVAKTVALVMAAGEAATQYGLTGWQDGEAEAAGLACFSDWLSRFGTENREEKRLMDQTRRLLSEEIARFPSLNSDGRYINMRMGFVDCVEGVIREYLVFPAQFESEVCKGFPLKWAVNVFRRQGWLRLRADGKSKVSIRGKALKLPEGKTTAMYALRHDVIFGDGDAPENGDTD
ncbi:MAG: DUF927 domain-containing protein [Alistipes senegalensis]|nr:DUF927 domain-containing protein [Oxalobacter formigenes]MCM1280739.1 DUF927 domain-containing protein [Alistipes senegalensis]